MPDAPKVAGFLSYAHDDDTHDNGRITRLRERLQLSIRVSSGVRNFTIFQDKSGIGWGSDWDQVITQSLEAVVLLFPIITPLWLASPNCREELQKFRLRQSTLGREGLILPVYCRETALIEADDPSSPEAERNAASLLRTLQHEDWRALRRTEETDPAYPAAIERLAERATPLLRRFRTVVVEAAVPRGQPDGASPPPADNRPQPDSATAAISAGQTTERAMLPSEVQTRVVDQWGRGDFTTISAALKGTPAGARILVRPGHYNESLVIDRPIELVGDGEREDIVVEGVNAETLIFDTNIGYVRNVSFRQRGTNNYCVWIKQGRLTLEECDITGRSLSCVAISNAVDPRVRRNRIHDGASTGLFVYNDARGTYEDNEIFANDLSGVQVSHNADPVVRRNRIHDGNGVWNLDFLGMRAGHMNTMTTSAIPS